MPRAAAAPLTAPNAFLMQEVEVKILEVEPAAIAARLESLGAVKTFEGELYALFFDFAERPITRRGDVLRLRREGPDTRLTYKVHRSREGAKVMEEFETSVGSLETLKEILLLLGLEQLKSTRKFRTIYELEGLHYALDDYQDELAAIPPFLEIEGETEEAVFAAAARLGYSPQQCLSWSTYELAKHYLPGF
jgi:adenylate cyclase class 2